MQIRRLKSRLRLQSPPSWTSGLSSSRGYACKVHLRGLQASAQVAATLAKSTFVDFRPQLKSRLRLQSPPSWTSGLSSSRGYACKVHLRGLQSPADEGRLCMRCGDFNRPIFANRRSTRGRCPSARRESTPARGRRRHSFARTRLSQASAEGENRLHFRPRRSS